MRKKLLIGLVIILVLSGLLYAFRTPLLRSCATALMHEDEPQKCDAIFVLSGGAYDRGNKAADLYKQGMAPLLICTGANPFVELRALRIDTLESDMTIANLTRLAVPDAALRQIEYGTSTREEADTIIGYCKAQHFKKVMVVSSRLHTGRVYKVFGGQFKEAGIELLICGAPSSRFDELNWWKSEDGLIAVNNEWLKRFYYLLKY